MGRQAYLTRLALGRSAFQPPAEPAAETNGETQPDSLLQGQNSTVESESHHDDQKYDSRGYAIDPASTDLKRRLTHAQNDILATVGVCAKVDGTSGSRRSRFGVDRSQVEIVKSENESGLIISAVDLTVMTLIEPWAVGLRQRLQAFRFLSRQPLASTIRSEWKTWRPLKFFFAGAPAGLAYYIVEYNKVEGTAMLYYLGYVALLEFLGRSSEPKNMSGPGVRLLFDSLKLVSFVFLAPLEVFATLQRLSIAPAWPVMPDSESYWSILRGLCQINYLPKHVTLITTFQFLRSVATTPVVMLAITAYTKPAVTTKLYKYIRAVLPKPTHPDKNSLQGAREDELDSVAVPGLIDAGISEDFEDLRFSDVLARDLQAVGRYWQIVRDWCANATTGTLEWLSMMDGIDDGVSDAGRSSSSTVPPLPSDLREAMGSISEVVEISGQLSPPITPVLGLRPELQDLLDPMPGTATRRPGRTSPPPSSRLRFPSSDSDFPTPSQNQSPSADAEPSPDTTLQANRPPIRRDSGASSIIPSRLSTPSPPIDITTSINRTGSLHMNVTIPADIASRPGNSGQGFRPPPASSSDSDDSDSEKDEPRPHHRVTALTAHAAEAMAQHLSCHLADLLFLPLEALFVRSVALTFWSAPGLSIATRGAAERWRGDVYPLGSWFGIGLRAGGWRAASDYAGKMILIWGAQVGLGFVVWEITTGMMWWAGLKWYGWTSL